MADQTKIEWADSTWNPWIGCQKITPACDNCYAETWDNRFHGGHWGPHATRRRTAPATWRKPITWQNQARTFYQVHGRRRRVFCASLADVFDNAVPTEWREDLWDLILATPDLIWMLLTKRPQNIEKVKPAFWDEIKGRIWLGTTVEDQERADLNIPHLLQHDAAVLFVSIEPMLGPIDLTHVWAQMPNGGKSLWDCLRKPINGERLGWVITGGESGPNARPSHPGWFRSVRDQCAEAGVPYLHKQNGEYAPIINQSTATAEYGEGKIINSPIPILSGKQRLVRIGKKRAGRLLDGREHNGFPVSGETVERQP